MIEKNIELCYNNKKNVDIRMIAMHKIVSSYLKQFCEDNVISPEEKESKILEYFINHCIAYSMYPSFVDYKEITSDEDDEGIDGILFLVDGELVTTTEEAIAILSRPKKNIEVEICFIQTKSSESFDRGEILKFGDGVYDFLSDEPTLPQGEFIKNAKKIFNYIIENVSKIKNGRPTVCLRYVCTSTNDIAVEIEATRKNIETKIRKTEYFSNVDFIISGLSDIMKLWDSTNNNSEAKLPVEKSVSYPVMEGIKEAYIAIVSIKEYINNILLNQDGRMRLNIYEENVRAFLGVENPVNKKIKDTILNLEKSDKFAVYNNGITIISPDVRYQNNQISLENFQIVNGCQTSNVLYECRDNIPDNATITIKIIEADDPDVIADIVRATNNQSKVDESQFLSFSPFVRRLEKYFDASQDIDQKEMKLYFERRVGQYKTGDVPKKKIFSISEVCRALGAIFLIVPDMASRYPTKFLSQMSDKLFDEQNKEEPYYVAALVNYKFKQFSTRGRLLNKFVIYKWHILTIFGYVVTGKTPPSLKNKSKAASYCNEIKKTCMSDDKCQEAFKKSLEIIQEIGLKNNRDEVRSTAYANEVKKYCNNKLIKNDKK